MSKYRIVITLDVVATDLDAETIQRRMETFIDPADLNAQLLDGERIDVQETCIEVSHATVKPWTYEGYWAQVLGANRDASDVVREFALVTAAGLDEWLGGAEADAWAAGGRGKQADLPEEWDAFHTRALAEIEAALARAAGEAQS